LGFKGVRRFYKRDCIRFSMGRVVGYIVAVVGLVILGLGTGGANTPSINFLKGFSSFSVSIVGVVLVILGIFLVRGGKGKVKQASEVPIYEGVGKKRRVVGYQRE